MSTAIQQTTTRTTRSGTRVVTSSNSSSSLRSNAKTPVLGGVKPRVPIPRDARAAPARPEARHSLQKDPRSRTPVLREPRSKRDLAAAAAAGTSAGTAAAATATAANANANAAAAASVPSAPPTPPPHSATPSTLPVTSISGLRTPSPVPPLDGMLEGRAPLSLFVTNIRLLKLNLIPGFPNITVNTFVPPGPGTQGQKRRIQCAEWVLFHLFSIWDPEEAESKLRPFFPPQDPDQSVELRAALFKSLERAKKMGALSRDALVRKSALEDCKADRLEEILASFSTTVLKKVVLEKLANTNTRPDAILSYATQNSLGHRADRSELTAMTLAYRSSIRRMMQQKEAARTQYRDFTDLLAVEEQDAARRHEAILAREIEGTGQPVSDNARAEMRKTLRNNWAGNEAWMEALFGGESRETGLTASPFDDVWGKLHQGRLAEAETQGAGLLQQLESRVRLQRERLQKWNAFRRDTFGRSQADAPAHAAKAARTTLRGIDLGFENHMNLQVGKMARLSLKNRGAREPAMSNDYAAIVAGLNRDLARISNKDVDLATLLAAYLPKKQDKSPRRHRSTSSLGGSGGGGGDDAASDISDLDDAEKSFPADFHQPTSFPDRLAPGSLGRSSLRPKLSRPDLTSIAVEGSSGPALPLGKLNFPGKSAYDIDQFDIPEPPTPPKEEAPTPLSKRRTVPATPTARDAARHAASPPSKRRTAPSTPARRASGSSSSSNCDKPATPPSKSRKPRRPDTTSLDLPSTAVLQDQMTMSPTRYYYADADDDARSHAHAHTHARAASPPPVRRSKPRHTLSVLERKQLSLSRKSSFFLEDDEPDLIHEPASTCGSTAEHTAEEDGKESSGEMTDQSSKQQQQQQQQQAQQAQQAHHHPREKTQQHQLRRSGRRAMTLPQKPTFPPFPAVAVAVAAADAEEGGERLLERLTLEQDYEAVFRSRPKIAQNSPVKGYGLSDYFA